MGTPITCRICESACGLIADVHEQNVLELRPDPEHQVSQGFACIKGTRFTHIQNHPRRVLKPLLRQSDGTLAETSWPDALAVLGEKLARIHREHGPQAIGIFSGNAAGNSLGAVLGITALRRAFGTTKHYSCLTLDNSEQFVVLEEVFGNPMCTFVADYAGADFVLLIGTDPLSSQPSQSQSHPNGPREIAERGRMGQLAVIDPRRSSTAARASLHLAPKPGSDLAVLGFLLHEALHAERKGSPLGRSERELLREVTARFTAPAVTAIAGVAEHDLLELRSRVLSAERPLVWSGLGVLLGRDGTLGYWLTLVLQAALGGIDRPGGWLRQAGAVDITRVFGWLGVKARDPQVTSRVGGYPAVLGTVAAATLADDINTAGDDQLRALVVVGGNPAISLPHTGRAQAALRNLELLVCLDLFVNDTGTLAHAVLPACTWLERSDSNVYMAQQRRLPHLQISPAVVPPRGEAREDWRILTDLARAAGRPPFGSRLASSALRAGLGPHTLSRFLVGALSPWSWRELRGAARGLLANRPDHGALADVKPRWVPRELLAALEQRSIELTAAGQIASTERRLQLVSSVRPVATMNSWYHDTPAARRRASQARCHPSDLRSIGVSDGARVRLQSDHGSVVVTVAEDDGVRAGVVVLPYGWGHLPGAVGAGDDAPGGVNVNHLIGTDELEPFTGQPISNGRWITMHPHPEGDVC